eukprot:2152281-Alexandrium_andersonii.AAC.1
MPDVGAWLGGSNPPPPYLSKNRLQHARRPGSLGFGIGMNNLAEHTPWGLRWPALMSFLGPRSASSERMKRFCISQRSRIGAPT